MQPSAEHLEGLETRIAASLRRTGQNFILIWPVVAVLVWAAGHYSNNYLRIAATLALCSILIVVCGPNIGRIAALNKINFGMFKQLRLQLVLADIGAFLVIYAAIALWWPLPLPVAATLVAFALAFINSQAAEPSAA